MQKSSLSCLQFAGLFTGTALNLGSAAPKLARFPVLTHAQLLEAHTLRPNSTFKKDRKPGIEAKGTHSGL